MKKLFLSALCALTLGLMATSCNEDEPVSNGSGTEETAFQGAILINEGSMGLNNAGVTFYDKVSGEVSELPQFSAMGDVANNGLLGSNGKVYVTLTNSKTLAIAEVKTLAGATLKQVSLDYQPRRMAEQDGYLYISCYGGYLLKFNMQSEKVESTLKLEGGQNLEGIAAVGQTLYVCNSYYVDEQGNYIYLDKILTVNLKDFTQGETFQTVLNPNYLTMVDGHLFVLGFGDYYMTPYQIAEINTSNHESSYIAEGTKMCAWGKKLLFANSQTDWSNYPNVSTHTNFGAYDTTTGELDEKPFATMPESVSKESIYFLEANPANGEILMGVTDYVTTSTIHLFDAKGQHQNSFDSKGMNTNGAVFMN